MQYAVFVADLLGLWGSVGEMTHSVNAQQGTFLVPLRHLFDKGIRYSTVIDVGCADGSFFLTLWSMGIIPGAAPLNVDANRLYEDSLSAIKTAAGGDYFIGAVADYEGQSELTTAIHPYWSSLRPKHDLYWERINNLSSSKTVVPVTTLDVLCKQRQPPFLLKLDVQGAEQEVLRGATDTLRNTHVVICEADIADFRKIDNILGERDFVLYDVTNLERTADGTLGWFYPVYTNVALENVRPKEFWNPRDNEAVIQAQGQRRESILKWNAEILARMRQPPTTKLSRNDPCLCGSGKKYKHCCGLYK
jgi:FkbM family methyltransferase